MHCVVPAWQLGHKQAPTLFRLWDKYESRTLCLQIQKKNQDPRALNQHKTTLSSKPMWTQLSQFNCILGSPTYCSHAGEGLPVMHRSAVLCTGQSMDNWPILPCHLDRRTSGVGLYLQKYIKSHPDASQQACLTVHVGLLLDKWHPRRKRISSFHAFAAHPIDAMEMLLSCSHHLDGVYFGFKRHWLWIKICQYQMPWLPVPMFHQSLPLHMCWLSVPFVTEINISESVFQWNTWLLSKPGSPTGLLPT